MKVLLINPSVPTALKKENLGLAYLSACLQRAGHETQIVDEIPGQDIEATLDTFRPDVACISFMTMFAVRAYALADRIRAKRGIPVILGGAHATALPEEAIQHGDCVVRGEGEITLPAIIDSGRIEGIVEASPCMDLDDLPMPAREQLDLDYYVSSGEELAGLSYRTLGIITSRGCPFHCDFCVNSKREVKLRFHSPERVIEEIQHLVDRYNIESIAFYDELLATDQKRFRAICEGMIEANLHHLRWECQVHPRTVRDDMLPLMKQAGCVQVAIGFESGSQAILDKIHKNSSAEQNLEVARKVREAGLRLRGCFIFGTPGETMEDLKQTEAFIKQAKIDFASMHFLTPYPGTVLYDQLQDKMAGQPPIPWDKFTSGDPDTFPCNDAIPRADQKRIFERMTSRLAFRNYSFRDMVARALQNPRFALHVASKLFR